jgi:hypothetical protein
MLPNADPPFEKERIVQTLFSLLVLSLSSSLLDHFEKQTTSPLSQSPATVAALFVPALRQPR